MSTTVDSRPMILAGDIGGTKSTLGLFVEGDSTLNGIFKRRFATRDYPGFESIIDNFLLQAMADGVITDRSSIAAAGFGVAGVVTGGRHYSENLPWMLDVASLSESLKLKHIRLLNDLAATALSLVTLCPDDVVTLNAGTRIPEATQGVIAAGTGLGEALLFWDGKKYRVAGAEGGQADFAPRTDREIRLLTHLKRELPHVSCEEIASGRGFFRIHKFLDPSIRHESFESADSNPASEITQRGLAKSCRVCEETLELWVDILAGVTGNFALQTMTLGGVFIAGGIPVKILAKLREASFFKSFCGVGKLAEVMAQVPLFVVINEDAPVRGAAYEALRYFRSKLREIS